MPSDAARAQTLIRLARFYLGLTVATFVLVVVGALVRAHGAGLACPDWPLCFGVAVPTFEAGVAWEVGHRYFAGTVGLFAIGGAAWIGFSPVARRVALAPALVSLGVLALQVVLGGLTVLQFVAPWTVTSHLLAGNAFLLVLYWTSERLRDAARPAPLSTSHVASPAVGVLVVAACVLLSFQIALGGLVSSNYAGLVCPDWPTCAGGRWYPSWQGALGLHLAHRTTGYALVVVLGATAALARGAARRPAAATLGLVLAQVAAGVANVLLSLPVELTGLHTALASGLVLAMVAVVRRTFARGAAG